ncbi:unnamed protein product [Schistocephalus solidus]|uniref:Alba domain-containing protein n=1 Tax=Schistocephalus solidus TaxID=70667 RepID=A0A183T4A2_SCHSO|nr:unnamed protein product [Schistocephalus solidus]
MVERPPNAGAVKKGDEALKKAKLELGTSVIRYHGWSSETGDPPTDEILEGVNSHVWQRDGIIQVGIPIDGGSEGSVVSVTVVLKTL